MPPTEAMPRPKILVFQHVPFEPLGTLDPLLKEAGFRIRYVNFGREPEPKPALEKYEALIVLGGPMNSDQIDSYPNLITEVEIIREAVDSDMSVLGICLGAQLLAKALGGSVSRNPVREIGWYDVELTEAGTDDPVLASFAPRNRSFSGTKTASRCRRVRCTWRSDASPGPGVSLRQAGVRFPVSPRGQSPLIDRWLTVPDHQATLVRSRGESDADTIRRQTVESIGPLKELSRRTFSRWIDQFEIRPRQRRLPSR